MDTTLIMATRNSHKLAEIRALLASHQGGLRVVGLEEISEAPQLVEDGKSLAENAARKATQLTDWLRVSSQGVPDLEAEAGCAVLADDSGLEVDALGGEPGVHSARFAALDQGGHANSSDGENNAKLLRLLGNLPLEKRTARFRCFLALSAVPRSESARLEPVMLFEGVCEGAIGFGPRGERGFGYDPLFIPAGFTQSFGELGEEEKNRISHRCRALEKLKAHLKSR